MRTFEIFNVYMIKKKSISSKHRYMIKYSLKNYTEGGILLYVQDSIAYNNFVLTEAFMF